MSQLFSKALDGLSKKASTSGSLLRAFRKGLRLSQEDLEKITGIRSTNISALENDKLPFTAHYADIFCSGTWNSSSSSFVP